MDWQTNLSMVIVASSAFVLVWKIYRSATMQVSGCGSCSNCPADSSDRPGMPKATTLVQINDRTA